MTLSSSHNILVCSFLPQIVQVNLYLVSVQFTIIIIIVSLVPSTAVYQASNYLCFITLLNVVHTSGCRNVNTPCIMFNIIVILTCTIQHIPKFKGMNGMDGNAYEYSKKNSIACSAMKSFPMITDDQKKLCQHVLRMHRVSFRKMSACGLFHIDVCHPVRLLALLTHYTVVLLQFAFL